jgi:hypothetical protein
MAGLTQIEDTISIPMATTFEALSSPDRTASAIPENVKHLATQLDQWRGMLPSYLRWQEGQPDAFSNPSQDLFSQGIYPSPSMQDLSAASFMFTVDLDSPPVSYPYVADVQVASLRTKYYYTKYLIHRPFLYKAIHHADLMTREDAEGAVECLKACLKWPITMSPTCCHKRLVPNLFFWSQNLLGILIILHLSQQHPFLSRIRTTLCDDRFEADATETVNLCIDWIRDLKNIDATAKWCWAILGGLYHLED